MESSRVAMVGVLVIVLLCAFAFIVSNGITGNVSSYGGPRVYGPGLKTYYAKMAKVARVSSADIDLQRIQGHIAANRDKLDCSFTTSDGPYPCEFDQKKGRWCCLTDGTDMRVQVSS